MKYPNTHVICHMSHVSCHISHVIRHISCVHGMSHATCHMSLVTRSQIVFFLQKGPFDLTPKFNKKNFLFLIITKKYIYLFLYRVLLYLYRVLLYLYPIWLYQYRPVLLCRPRLPHTVSPESASALKCTESAMHCDNGSDHKKFDFKSLFECRQSLVFHIEDSLVYIKI